MQRYRHYGASTPSATSLAAPAEEPHSTQKALNAREQVCEEQVEPVVSEEAQDGLKKTGGDISEEAAATQQAPLFSETKPPESKSSKKAAGGDVGAGAKYSVFTWFAVLALLGVWSSVAVVYFDIVDYDSVVGKLTAYDTDGDGDFDVEDAKVLLDGKRLKASRRRQAYRKVLREMDEDPDEKEVNEDEIPAETTLRKNGTRELPIRDDALRSALQEELSAIHEKTEAKRIARVALAEIKAFLAAADDDQGRETAWQLKMKTLEVTQEQLKLQRERIAVETERMEVEKKRMEWERKRMEWEEVEREKSEREKAERERTEREKAERERKEQEKAEKERTEREKAEREKREREKAEQAKLALQKAKQEQEQLEKKERERLVGEQEATKERVERERLAAEKSERERKEQMAKERERMEKEKLEQEREKAERERQDKERAEKEILAKERARLAQEKEKAAREKAAREKAEPERPDARKANSTQTPEEKSQRAGVTAARREKGVIADKMAAGGRKK